ncbi:MAG TPA: Ig-like domain repeat protein [Acidimicrobiales bacterium]|nr:Ig-like domain repeat protein [Acidimicrobiales bacterium]
MAGDAGRLRRGGRTPRLLALVLGSAGVVAAGVALSLLDPAPAWADPATVTSPPASPSNNLHPSWTFTATGTSFRCELLNPDGTTFSPWTTCTSPVTYNLTGHADGVYTFFAADSKSSPPPATEISNPSRYTLDTTPPAAPTFTSAPASPGNGQSPRWTFTPESGSTTKCQVTDSSGTVISAYSACTSPATVDLSAQPDDTYTLSVTATDAAGNTSVPATSPYQLLTTAPATPTFTAEPPSPGKDKAPSWSFTTPPGTTTTCQLTNSANTVLTAYASCTSPVTVDLSSQPDDTYTLSVVATDAASNQSSPAASSYQLMTAIPAAPTLTSSPASPGSSPEPSWFFTLPAGTAATCQLTDSAGTVVSAYAPCTSPTTVDLSSQPDDTYTLAVVATDAAGNASLPTTSSYVLDTTPPPVPTFSATPTWPGRSTDPSWSFTVQGGAGAECQVTDSAGTVISAYTDCTSPYTFDLSGKPDDTYTLSVVADNAADVASAPATSSYTLDTTPPAAPTITAAPASPGNSTHPRWSFTSPAGTTTSCQVTDSPGTVISAFAPCSSPYTADLTGRPDDTYTVTIVATDAADNASGPTTSTYQLLTTPPVAPTITSGPTGAGGSTLSWDFSPPPGTTISCQLTGPGGTVLSAWAACTSPVSFPISGAPGTYTLSVEATDAAGNTSPVATDSFRINPPPAPPPPAPAPPAAPTPPAAPPATPAPTPPLPPVPTLPVVPPPPAPVAPIPAPVTPVPPPPPAPAPVPPAPVATAVTPAPPAPAPVVVPRPVALPPAAPLPPPPAPARAVVRPPAPTAPVAPGLVERVRRAGLALSEGSAAAFLLYLVVMAFLALQNRIDRNDPKLALAPVYGEPDLAFEAPPHLGGGVR